jgi:predicted ATPase/DNA-binding SARP family transcriptional activator
MAERWRIELFGGLRARHGERVISRFQKQKAGSLLAYLAYYPRAHSREALAGVLWPGGDVEAGRSNLRGVLHALRRQLEPDLSSGDALLTADRDTVGLRPGAFTTDIAEWEAALGGASRPAADRQSVSSVARLARAVDLYRGELLSGCVDDWVLIERERRAEEYVRALRELAAALEQTGDLERAIQAARQAVDADPLREEAQFSLMRLYAAAGQPSATRQQYQEWERVLREELGETPSPATRALADALCDQARAVVAGRRGSPALGSAPPPAPGARRPAPGGAAAGQPASSEPGAWRLAPGAASGARQETAVLGLPPHATRFFGREAEIVRVMEALCLPGTRLLTLTGPGGSGKTRLAAAVAEGLAGAGPRVTPFQAIAFVPLADLLDAGRLADAIGDRIGAPQAAAPDPLERAVAGLQGQTWLLILDNVEHLAAEGALLVRRLLDRVLTLTCLVTSRQRLNLAIEREFPVPPLPVPEAVSLFVDRAQAVRPEFQLTEANRAAVAELCQRLEGLPLALELAAARATVLSPAQLLDRLEHRFELLVTRQRDVPPRHRTLFAALAGSYELLSSELQQFFVRLSVFRGGWTLAAAEAIAVPPSAGARGRSAVIDLIEQLRDCSLVIADATEEEPRYRMLETLREFAAGQLAAEEQQALRQQHAAFFLALAEGSTSPAVRPEAAVVRLEREYPNLCAALSWSLGEEGSGEIALRLACRLEPLWQRRRVEGREWLTAALARNPDAPPGLRAEALYRMAHLAGLDNDDRAAGDALEEALCLRQGIGDDAGVAPILVELALVARAHDEFARAQTLLEDAAAIWRRLDDAPGLAWTLENLAWIVQRQGDHARAEALLRQCLTFARERALLDVAAYALHGLGWLAVLDGDLAGARLLLQQSVEAARELIQAGGPISHRSRIVRRWFELDPEAAGEVLEQTLAFNRALGHDWMVMHMLGALGHVARTRGDYERCAACYRESLALRHARGDWFAIAQSLEDFACLAALQADHERAARLLGAAEVVCERLGRSLPVAVPEEYERAVAHARAALGGTAFAEAWAAGRRLSLDEAIAYASR